MANKCQTHAKLPGVVEGNDPGFYGDDVPHILTYDPAKTLGFATPFIASDLTVCANILAWGSHLGLVAYALLLMVLLAYTAFPDGDIGAGPACANGQNSQMCQLNDTLLAAKTEFRFLIAFILAGFVGVTVNIWYMRRKNYAALCGSCRNLLIQLATFVPFDADNLQLMATRQKLARWVSLAYELAILKARGHMDSDQGYGHLVEVGLLEPAEWECLVNGDRHSTVIFWIQREVMRMGEKGLIHATHVQTCASAIGFMRSQGVQWSIWLRTFGDDIWQQPKFYADILVLLSWNVSYAALFDLSQTLHNPFKFRRIDVAHETISKGIRQLGVALMGPGNLPPEAPTPSFVGTYATIRHHYPTILPPGWVQGVAQVQAPYPRPSPYVAIQDL